MKDASNILIGITGGIGAGKSVVSRILRLQNYPVYDCDSRARVLMEESEEILIALKARFGNECVLADGGLDRGLIASRVFSDDEERLWLNSLVHAEVRRDIGLWRNGSDAGIRFVESAIMFSSGLDRMCDEIWLVDAPEATRVERAMNRGGITKEDLLRRIEAQHSEFDLLPQNKVRRILNDGTSSLLEQIKQLITNIQQYA